MYVNNYRPPYPNELYHHGIKGQTWGVRNGPPYPLGAAVSSEIKKVASSVKDRVSSGAKKAHSNSYARNVIKQEQITNRINKLESQKAKRGFRSSVKDQRAIEKASRTSAKYYKYKIKAGKGSKRAAKKLAKLERPYNKMMLKKAKAEQRQAKYDKKIQTQEKKLISLKKTMARQQKKFTADELKLGKALVEAYRKRQQTTYKWKPRYMTLRDTFYYV